jgi:hypothetical protein
MRLIKELKNIINHKVMEEIIEMIEGGINNKIIFLDKIIKNPKAEKTITKMITEDMEEIIEINIITEIMDIIIIIITKHNKINNNNNNPF